MGIVVYVADNGELGLIKVFMEDFWQGRSEIVTIVKRQVDEYYQ